MIGRHVHTIDLKIFVAAFTLGLASCISQPKQSDYEPYCPEPTQDCRPAVWMGQPFDTSSSTSLESEYYLKIEPLVTINSAQNDLALHFLTERQAIGTFGGQAAQAIETVTLRTEVLARRSGMIDVSDRFATAGAVSVAGGDAALSAIVKGAIPGDADIYLGVRGESDLRNVQKLGEGINTLQAWDAQPAFFPGGNVLFFASDRKGGLGGTDIWMTVRNANGVWSAPINCGPSVNTRCDELTPFVTTDGSTLLFASAGHVTVGGYDIFRCDIDPTFQSAVKRAIADSDRDAAPSVPATLFRPAANLGTPLNTEFDELYPSSPGDIDTLLYYTSTQTPPAYVRDVQTGGFDLYVLRRVPRRRPDLARIEPKTPDYTTASSTPAPAQNEPQENNDTTRIARDTTIALTPADVRPVSDSVLIFGTVIDVTSQQPVDSARVSVREVESQEIIAQAITDALGQYRLNIPRGVEVEISAQAKDRFYDAYKVKFETNDTTTVYVRDLTLPEERFLRINFPLDDYTNPYPFMLDSNGLQTTERWTEAMALIAEDLKRHRSSLLKVVIIGHTDEAAGTQYNKRLGQRRADFVRNKLIARGVDPTLLTARSAGEEQLLVRRANEPEELYRKRCRRVAMKKILK